MKHWNTLLSLTREALLSEINDKNFAAVLRLCHQVCKIETLQQVIEMDRSGIEYRIKQEYEELERIVKEEKLFSKCDLNNI